MPDSLPSPLDMRWTERARTITETPLSHFLPSSDDQYRDILPLFFAFSFAFFFLLSPFSSPFRHFVIDYYHGWWDREYHTFLCSAIQTNRWFSRRPSSLFLFFLVLFCFLFPYPMTIEREMSAVLQALSEAGRHRYMVMLFKVRCHMPPSLFSSRGWEEREIAALVLSPPACLPCLRCQHDVSLQPICTLSLVCFLPEVKNTWAPYMHAHIHIIWTDWD